MPDHVQARTDPMAPKPKGPNSWVWSLIIFIVLVVVITVIVVAG